MQFSVFACLVLAAAVCDVSAQWRNGRGLSSVGVVSLDDCAYCDLSDLCVHRPEGQVMCQRSTGALYAPLRPLRSRMGQAMIGGRGFVDPLVFDQGFVKRGMVDQGFVPQDFVNQGVLSQRFANRRHPGQAVVNQGLLGASLLGLQSSRRRAGCCTQQDQFSCAVDHYIGNNYINGGICRKFYFDAQSQSCQEIQVYTQCVEALRPRNMFSTAKQCRAKCAVVGY